MERLIKALTEMVRRDARKPERPRKIAVDVGAAPACVGALVDALASSAPSVDLGEFSLSDTTDPIVTLETAFEMAVEAGFEDLDGYLATAGPGRTPLEVAATLELAPDGGGMSSLGVVWSGGAAHLVIVEMEDPTRDNLVRLMSTPEAFFAQLDRVNRKTTGKDLEALRAQLGLAVAPVTPAAPASALRVWDGPAPPHPFAEARAEFPGKLVLQAAPSAGGRVVLVRRFTAGHPPTESQLVVRAAGTATPLEWPGLTDISGVCPVPGRERVLLCGGSMGGPLVEVDLESGARRELLPRVGWSCGFVDADHLVVFADKTLRVYRWSDAALAEPIATAPAADVANVFVGHGHVFGKTMDYQTTSFRIFRWNGTTLDDRGPHQVPTKVFTLHAAVEHAGQKLVASVDTKGNASWFAFDPA